MKLAKDVKGNKRKFYHYISSRRRNKENTGPLLNGVGYLVTVDTEKLRYIAPSLPQPSLTRSLGHLG